MQGMLTRYISKDHYSYAVIESLSGSDCEKRLVSDLNIIVQYRQVYIR